MGNIPMLTWLIEPKYQHLRMLTKVNYKREFFVGLLSNMKIFTQNNTNQFSVDLQNNHRLPLKI